MKPKKRDEKKVLIYLFICFTSLSYIHTGVWTLIFGAFCLKTNEDAFTWTKFLSVLISLGGVIVLNSGDVSFGLGDIFALASAIFYASYLTLFKYSGDDGELDMAMFFGKQQINK